MRNLSDRELLSLFDTAVSDFEVGPPPEALRGRSLAGGDPLERSRRPLVMMVAASIVAAAVVAGGGYWLTTAGTDPRPDSVVADDGDSNPPSTPPSPTVSKDPAAQCEGPSLIVDFGRGYSSPEDALRGMAIEPGQQTRLQEVVPPPNNRTDPVARGVVLDPDGTVVKSVSMSLITDGWTVARVTFCR